MNADEAIEILRRERWPGHEAFQIGDLIREQAARIEKLEARRPAPSLEWLEKWRFVVAMKARDSARVYVPKRSRCQCRPCRLLRRIDRRIKEARG